MKDETRYIKTGGRRIALYAELGRYFAPDGQFCAMEFRALLKEALGRRMAQVCTAHSDDKADDVVSRWLSAHIEDVLAYLLDRGLDRAAYALFEAALEEAATCGNLSITLPPERMRWLLAASKESDPATNPPRRRDPTGKRQIIFDAALAVFAERGFHTATMDDIAKASGVAKGTLYRYFQSKEELLEQLLRSTSQALAARFAEAFGREGDILEQIENFVTLWLAFIEENHTLYRLVQVEGLNAPVGRQTMLYEYLLDDFPMVKERIAALDTSGVLKTPNFYPVAYGVLGFIDGVVRKWFRSGMEYPLQEELPVILEVLFNGFVHASSRSRTFYSAPEESPHPEKAKNAD